jgi:hypothetical protein
MAVLAGLFLTAHGLVHLAIWIPEPRDETPFDPHHSWLLGDAVSLSKALAVISCVLFVPVGILVIAGAGLGAALAIAGAGFSLLLVLLTAQPWFAFAAAINVGIILVALG